MRGRHRVAKAPAGECGVKSQVSCCAYLKFDFCSRAEMLHSLGDERKKYRERFDREGMDGGNAWRTFGKCICELKRGMKYPFP